MPYVIIILILLTSYPFMFCRFLPIPPISVLGVVYFLLLACILFIRRHWVRFPLRFDVIFFIQFICWACYFVLHSDTTYITRIVLMSVAYMALLYVYNSPKGIVPFLKIFNGIILVMAVCGVLCFFLVLLGVIKAPLFNYVNVDERTGYCFGLSCTNTYLGNIIRYSGYFDEPGAMASWGVFALLFNRLFIKSKRYEIVLGICLLFTFSISYFIQIILYMVLFAKNRVKRIIQLAAIVTVVIMGLQLMQDSPYGQIYKMTVQRFEFDDRSNEFAGDNRSNLSEMAKEQFLKSPVIGIGAVNMSEIGYMDDNPYEILAKDGIIGEIVTYLPLLILFIIGLKRHPDYIYAVIILFTGYLQRPFHIGFIHPIMLYALTILSLQTEEEEYALS